MSRVDGIPAGPRGAAMIAGGMIGGGGGAGNGTMGAAGATGATSGGSAGATGAVGAVGGATVITETVGASVTVGAFGAEGSVV